MQHPKGRAVGNIGHWSIRVATAMIWAAFVPFVPARAADVVHADLQAAVRSLGFLDSLPRRPSIVVDVVYPSGSTEAKALAVRTAAALSKLAGPRSSTITANAVAVDELAQDSPHPDALYLLPGVAENSRVVADFARRRQVVSISDDPACLAAQCCVLMVRGGSRVDIVLDTAMAQQTGAKFSAVFTMMVTRK